MDDETMFGGWVEADFGPVELETAVLAFAKTGNPMFAWEALLKSHALGTEIPPQVKEYLLAVGGELLRLASRPPKRVAPLVQEAIFGSKASKGAGSVIRSYANHKKSLEIASAIDIYRMQQVTAEGEVPGLTFDAAVEQVCQDFGISTSVAKRAHRKWRGAPTGNTSGQ